CAAARSLTRTSPEPPAWRNAFADRSASSTTTLPGRRTRPAPCRDDSFKSLVHREGFEPSYLRGGADLQSAGFNHSPTCAELQNSPAVLLHPVFIADIPASVRRSFRRICKRTNACKREEQKCARVCYRTQTPHLENSLMECRWKICSAAAPRPISCVQ